MSSPCLEIHAQLHSQKMWQHQLIDTVWSTVCICQCWPCSWFLAKRGKGFGPRSWSGVDRGLVRAQENPRDETWKDMENDMERYETSEARAFEAGRSRPRFCSGGTASQCDIFKSLFSISFNIFNIQYPLIYFNHYFIVFNHFNHFLRHFSSFSSSYTFHILLHFETEDSDVDRWFSAALLGQLAVWLQWPKDATTPRRKQVPSPSVSLIRCLAHRQKQGEKTLSNLKWSIDTL